MRGSSEVGVIPPEGPEGLVVLVVDGTGRPSDSYGQWLEEDGYSAVFASSIAECCETARRLRPFAILLDRKLDDGHVHDALPALRKVSPLSSIVITAGVADVEGVVEALRLGVSDYLVKPIEPDVLRKALARLRQQYLNEVRLREVQSELERSEERLSMIVRATRDALWDCDLVGGTVWKNDRYGELFGASGTGEGAPLEGRFEKMHPADRAAARQSLEAALAGDDEVWRAEYRYRRGDGTYADVIDRAFIARGADGTAVRVVGAMDDVTEQRRIEEDFRRAQKMDAVGRLAGGVAHEFNNLLAGIVTSCKATREMLSHRDAEDLAEGRELLMAMERRALRGSALTRQLLDFSRSRPRERSRVELAAVIRGAELMLRGVLGESIVLEVRVGACEGAPDGLWIDGDTGLIEQVIMNLVLNGRDAMPDGGQIEISASVVQVNRGAQRGDLKPGTHAMLEVSDNGTGMPPEVSERVTEPFFTTKPRGYGTGLGLATVFGIVHEFAGHMEIESTPGEGTTVRLLFPLAEPGEPSVSDEPASEEASQLESKTGRILVVEDERLLRRATQLLLTSAGHTVSVAESPEEALDIFRSTDLPLDLLLADVNLKGDSGVELAEEISRLQPGLPVLFMSGYTDLPRVGERSGLGPLLAKPFEPEELLSMVAALMGGSS